MSAENSDGMNVEVDDDKIMLSSTSASNCWYNFFFMSRFSGTHSWRKNAPEIACLMSVQPARKIKNLFRWSFWDYYRRSCWTASPPTASRAEVHPAPMTSAATQPASTRSRPATRRCHKSPPCNPPKRISSPMTARSARYNRKCIIYIRSTVMHVAVLVVRAIRFRLWREKSCANSIETFLSRSSRVDKNIYFRSSYI